MSSITTTLPTAVTNGTAASATTNSFNSLSPSDFVNMMVTQLQNQDPLDPTNSQDLLTEMSQIGQLQSSTQLQSTLTGLSLQNQIGSGSSLIGKEVQGTDANNNEQTGLVTGVSITSTPSTATGGQTTSTVSLNLDTGATLPLANVTAIAPGPTPTTSGTATSPPTNTNSGTSPQASAGAAAAQQAVLSALAQGAVTSTTASASVPVISTATS